MTEIKELIAELRALEAKATPQPWHVMPDGFSKRPSPPTVYHTGDELNYVAKCADTWTIERTRNQENAELIAATRNALPQLLSALEALISRSAVMEEATPEMIARGVEILDDRYDLQLAVGGTATFEEIAEDLWCAMNDVRARASEQTGVV